MFEAGQQVVCGHDGAITSGYWTGDRIVKGSVYTVSGVCIHLGEEGLFLEGMHSNVALGAYRARRFRPLAKRSDTLTIESFLTIKPGFEEPRRVTKPVRWKEGVA